MVLVTRRQLTIVTRRQLFDKQTDGQMALPEAVWHQTDTVFLTARHLLLAVNEGCQHLAPHCYETYFRSIHKAARTRCSAAHGFHISLLCFVQVADSVGAATEGSNVCVACTAQSTCVSHVDLQRGRAAAKSPTKKQKIRRPSQPQSPVQPASPSSGTAKKTKTVEQTSPSNAPASSSPSDAAKQRRSRRPSAVSHLLLRHHTYCTSVMRHLRVCHFGF